MVATALALAAMLLPAVTPGALMVLCTGNDGTVSFEPAHASSADHHHHHDGDHEDGEAHEHGSQDVLDHEHGCTDRPLTGRFLTSGGSSAVAAPMVVGLAAADQPAPPSRAVAPTGDRTGAPPPRTYHRRTVVMLI